MGWLWWWAEPSYPPSLDMNRGFWSIENRCESPPVPLLTPYSTPIWIFVRRSLYPNEVWIRLSFLFYFPFQMTTYPSHFSQSLGNAGSMAYLKASPTYHLNGLSALGMSHGLDSLQSQSIHYGGGKYLVWLFCNSIWDFDCDSIGYWTYFWNIELSILCKMCKLLYAVQMSHLGRRACY